MRSQGVTSAERYLHKLATHSFLSLWSYSCLYRDQGQNAGKGDGKELCDLLVVFENHIIIFSDKDCKFPNSGDLNRDWKRWYRGAVHDAAKQLYGTERWLRRFPDRVFVDRACTKRFPIDLPNPSDAIYHRIAVSHGASTRCRQEHGGSGSLILMPRLIGDMHDDPERLGAPFMVGQVYPAKGYVHVLDDTTLDIVLRTLDTITDFLSYLTKKEDFIAQGRLGSAAGEEELLAHYLSHLNGRNEHDFFTAPGTQLVLPEGFWHDFQNSQQRQAQLEADEISYGWDALIEAFLKHVWQGTQHYTTHPGYENLREQEKAFRIMARENRTRRRMLMTAFYDLLQQTGNSFRGARVFAATRPGDPYYVFLLMKRSERMDEEDYRIARRNHLYQYCLVVRHLYPDAQDIVGIATDAGFDEYRSEDLAYLDGRVWTPEMDEDAKILRAEFKILLETNMVRQTEYEYPLEQSPRKQKRQARVSSPGELFHQPSLQKSYNGNWPCPCGSHRKYKRCHGKSD